MQHSLLLPKFTIYLALREFRRAVGQCNFFLFLFNILQMSKKDLKHNKEILLKTYIIICKEKNRIEINYDYTSALYCISTICLEKCR